MKRAAVLGGYNLVRIARLTFLFSDPYCRFQFCSIMALEAADSNGMEAPVHRKDFEIIERGCTECSILWKEGCITFIEELKKGFCRIV